MSVTACRALRVQSAVEARRSQRRSRGGGLIGEMSRSQSSCSSARMKRTARAATARPTGESRTSPYHASASSKAAVVAPPYTPGYYQHQYQLRYYVPPPTQPLIALPPNLAPCTGDAGSLWSRTMAPWSSTRHAAVGMTRSSVAREHRAFYAGPARPSSRTIRSTTRALSAPGELGQRHHATQPPTSPAHPATHASISNLTPHLH